MDPKENAARKALELVREGMVLGLGTGSTAEHFVRALGEAVGRGLSVRGVPSSRATEALARSLRIPLATLDEVGEVDLTVDGADEVDPDFNLIKGRGGALVREKILAAASGELAIVIDPSKWTDRLGKICPVPVEVIPYGLRPCRKSLEALGAGVTLRQTEDRVYVTDNGNQILDARFAEIPDPARLEREINAIPGVVDNGIFAGMARTVIIGTKEGAEVRRKRS